MPGNRLPRERFDSVAQQRHEFSHGFSKGLIILDDRYQCMFRHRGFHAIFSATGVPNASRLHATCVMSVKVRDKAMPAP